MNRPNTSKPGGDREMERKPFERPRLYVYKKGSFRNRTAQVTQRSTATSPIQPLGLELGGS